MGEFYYRSDYKILGLLKTSDILLVKKKEGKSLVIIPYSDSIKPDKLRII